MSADLRAVQEEQARDEHTVPHDRDLRVVEVEQQGVDDDDRLGDLEEVDVVRVYWPDGTESELSGVTTRQQITITRTP